ncbi:WXG100-like domain-containing protein [Mariniluteicoccus flavus]
MISLQLPAPLVTLLNELGIQWPEGDETKTFDYAQKWFDMGGKVSDARDEGDAGAKKVLESNEGPNADAFRESMTAEDGPSKSASGLTTGMQLGGGALTVGAAAILILKIQAIIQLVQLLIKELQAYAAAGPTMGASLAMIPTWRRLAKIAIEMAMNKTMETVQGQGGTQPTSGTNPTYGIVGEMLDGFVQPARRLPGEGAPAGQEGTTPPAAEGTPPVQGDAESGTPPATQGDAESGTPPATQGDAESATPTADAPAAEPAPGETEPIPTGA